MNKKSPIVEEKKIRILIFCPSEIILSGILRALESDGGIDIANVEKNTIDSFMESIKKPWIAFKTMAAGAIPPKEAFQFAFSNGADFILSGMFDFEIAEDVKLANEAMSGLKERSRPWIAAS